MFGLIIAVFAAGVIVGIVLDLIFHEHDEWRAL